VVYQIQLDEGGSKLLLSANEVKGFMDENWDDEAYMFKQIEMSEKEYEELPEFQGF